MSILTAALSASLAFTSAAGVVSSDLPASESPTATASKAWEATLSPWESRRIDAFMCPAGMHLENVDHYSEWERAVPKGVRVDEPGGVGVTIGDVEVRRNAAGHVIGWNSRPGVTSATNWDLFAFKTVTIWADCTSDLSKAYK